MQRHFAPRLLKYVENSDQILQAKSSLYNLVQCLVQGL